MGMIWHFLSACIGVGWLNLLMTALFLIVMTTGVITCGWATLQMSLIVAKRFLSSK